MIRKHNFNHSSASRVFLVSDCHFYHEKLVAGRGFASVDEHNKTLIDTWNNRVRPQDVVINLGDFILGAGEKSREKLDELLGVLNGRQYYIWGNHNAGVKTAYWEAVKEYFPTETEIYPIGYKNMTFLGNSMIAHVKTPERKDKTNHFVFCSHFAHRIWIDMNKGVLHASGHSHGNDQESNEHWLKTKRLDVGIENFGGPLDFDTFLDIMNTKTIEQLDHHGENTNPSF